MCGRKKWSILVIVFVITFFALDLIAGTVDVSCTDGVQDYDGSWLQGSGMAGTGDLLQIIYAGTDGVNDLPDPEGNPTDDDVLIGVTFAGAGYPLVENTGQFVMSFTDDLLATGNVIYVRAWNDQTIETATHYGDSQLQSVTLDGGGFGSNNFPTWQTGESWVAVELASFTATSITDGIRLAWITQSETENLGFHVFRSTIELGSYRQITDAIIPGAGSTQEQKHYSFVDQKVIADTTYYYKLADIDFNGNRALHGPISASVKPIPKDYKLEQNFPNPFNPYTAIAFDLKEDGNAVMKIYNLQGQLVRTLLNKNMHAGRHQVTWDATDDFGIKVPSGIYLYMLEAKGVRLSKSMLLVK